MASLCMRPGDGAISTFAINPTGALSFRTCIGDATGCTPTNPTSVLDGSAAISVTPNRANLYLASIGSAVSLFAIDSTGNLTYRGCIGAVTGCTPTNPRDALIGAATTAVSREGKHLYVAGSSVIPGGGATLSNFAISPAGNLSFRGCTGIGCSTTNIPSGEQAVLQDVSQLALSANSKQLYTTAGSTIGHFALQASGKPVFIDCIGRARTCTRTHPLDALDGPLRLAINPGRLYAGGFAALSTLTITPTKPG
jgi:hypothetical protein